MYIVAFKGSEIRRTWVKKEKTIMSLLSDGFTVYREATSQRALNGDKVEGLGGVIWVDVKETPEADETP